MNISDGNFSLFVQTLDGCYLRSENGQFARQGLKWLPVYIAIDIAGKGEIRRLEIGFCAQYSYIFRSSAPLLIELSCIKKARKRIE